MSAKPLRTVLASFLILVTAFTCIRCTKEDYGLSKEAREAISGFLGDYSCHIVTWSPEIRTKSGLLVLVDTNEAKTLTGAVLKLEGEQPSNSRGSISAEIPFYRLVSIYSTFFNRSVPKDFAHFPKSWKVAAKYRVDNSGRISFTNYEYDGISGYAINAAFEYDDVAQTIDLKVSAALEEGEKIDLGDFLNGFFSGDFKVQFRKD